MIYATDIVHDFRRRIDDEGIDDPLDFSSIVDIYMHELADAIRMIGNIESEECNKMYAEQDSEDDK